MPNSPDRVSNSPGPSTSSVISTIGYLGVGFVVLFAIFAIAFLSALFSMRESTRDTRSILNQDLEGTVERYNRPTTRGPRVGQPPASEQQELQVD